VDIEQVCNVDLVAQFIKLSFQNLRSDPYLIADRYRRAVVKEIATNYKLRDPMDVKLDLYPVSTERLNVACGRFGSRNKQEYWWPILHKQFPLIEIRIKGSKNKALGKLGTLTKVKVLFEMDWEEEYIGTIKEQVTASPNDYDWAPIDLDSIGAFILSARLKTLQKSAINIMAVAEQFKTDDKWARLPMLRKPADSGRVYYGGINLQNCPSTVRHAALGQHHSYDLRSSVYAWQMYMLRMIQDLGKYDTPSGTICTRELINDKHTVRNRLVETLVDTSGSYEHKLSIIKQALTAIGFGARKSNAYYENDVLQTKGLAGVIYDKGSREAFCNHPWVVEFMAEQDSIGKQICDAVLELVPEYRTDPIVCNNGKLSRKRLLAFLYQQSEARMIKHVMEQVKDADILLWVHDGFCTRKAINLPNINSILSMDYGDGIQLVHTSHDPWTEALPVVDEVAERARRHREEMAWHLSRGK
jgi:hypothetical protein